MNNIKDELIKETLMKFQVEKVMTIEQIAENLQRSIPTARNCLKQWDAITSYNKNGRYYVLPNVPKFNSYGLWKYKDIHFSKYGNLKNTLINIVENSSIGLDGITIGKLLGLDPRSFLSHFVKLCGLRREKISGRFIYFSSEEIKFKKQLSERLKSFEQKAGCPLPDSVGIVVLVEKIKHPKIGLEKLTKHLQNKGLPVNRKKIEDLFLYYGLQKNSGFLFVKALQKLVNKTIEAMSPARQFLKETKIYFKPETYFCPICHSRLKVMKTDKRSIVTLHIGKFKAHITFLTCYDCGNKTVYVSKELKELVSEYCNFGYDVMVEVGKSVFQKYRTADEIIYELQKRNVFLSGTQVYILAKKFITYLGLVHREIAPEIRKFMQKRGGYILHIDGTCEGGSCHLITVIDALSGFVLDSIKIPTENSSQIIPMLQRIKENYGDPIAVVSDMGLAIILALTIVFEHIPQFICHFHFLRDIGKDLFMTEYSVFQKQLKAYGISTKLQRKICQYEEEVDLDQELVDKLILSLESNTFSESFFTGNSIEVVCYALLLWASKAKSQSKAYAFPFDRQHFDFYQRLCTVYTSLKEIIKSYPEDQSKDIKTTRQIMNDLEGIVNDKLCKEIEPKITEKIEVFDNLRKGMRIALPDGKNGLNDDGEDTDIKIIEENVKKFYNWLIKKYSDNKDYKKMVEQIEKYWERLFADPIIVKTTAGEIKVHPQRTNNIMEQFFRKLKKIFLRKSGTLSTADTLKNMLADVPLIKNLENRDYMEIILNGKNSLEERFAEIDAESVRKEMNRNSKQKKMIKIIQRIIKDEDFPKKLVNIFKLRLAD